MRGTLRREVDTNNTVWQSASQLRVCVDFVCHTKEDRLPYDPVLVVKVAGVETVDHLGDTHLLAYARTDAPSCSYFMSGRRTFDEG